jgi:hypothetical protein
MTPKSLFNIILKVIGIFFIRDILALIPQEVPVVLMFLQRDTVSEGFWIIFMSLITVSVYAYISYYLIFKTEKIISKLKLTDGFDEEVLSINIHRSTILSISIIVIGGIILLDSIPNLCNNLASYIQQYCTYKQFFSAAPEPKSNYIIIDSVKIIIGLLLLGNQRKIVNYIEYRSRKRSE